MSDAEDELSGADAGEDTDDMDDMDDMEDMDDMDDMDELEDVDVADDMVGNRVPAAVATSVLDYVARAIVDEPDAVVVEAQEGRHGVTLRLHVAPEDMGKVIGRRGRVAQAIRAVVRAAGARDDTEVQVDIVD